MDTTEKAEKPKKQTLKEKAKEAALSGLILLGSIGGLGFLGDQMLNSGYGTRTIMDKTGVKEFNLKAENSDKFPYSFSPWEKYAETEEDLLDELRVSEDQIPRYTEGIINYGNSVSDHVAKKLLRNKNTSNIEDVLKETERDKVMKLTAETIRNSGIFYSEESLLSKAFNPEIHEEGKAHLDCDLLANLFMHVGRRFNIPIHAVHSPGHMYLQVETLDEEKAYIIEPTQFRKVERGEGYVNYGGKGLGDKFFSSYALQRERASQVADEDFEEREGFHKPVFDEGKLEDIIKTQILSGISKHASRKDDLELKKRIQAKLMQEFEDGLQGYTGISNTYTASLNLGIDLTDAGRLKEAESAIKDAIEVRRLENDYIVSQEPKAKVQLGKIYVAQGRKGEASRIFRETLNQYKDMGGFLKTRSGSIAARNANHLILLKESAKLEIEKGYKSDRAIYNELIVPAFNYLSLNRISEEDKHFKEVKAIKSKLEKSMDSGSYWSRKSNRSDKRSDLDRIMEDYKEIKNMLDKYKGRGY